MIKSNILNGQFIKLTNQIYDTIYGRIVNFENYFIINWINLIPQNFEYVISDIHCRGYPAPPPYKDLSEDGSYRIYYHSKMTPSWNVEILDIDEMQLRLLMA
jgi:hypothetical protein